MSVSENAAKFAFGAFSVVTAASTALGAAALVTELAPVLILGGVVVGTVALAGAGIAYGVEQAADPVSDAYGWVCRQFGGSDPEAVEVLTAPVEQRAPDDIKIIATPRRHEFRPTSCEALDLAERDLVAA